MKIELWSLPKRRDMIRQLRQSGTRDSDYQLSFQGRQQTFPVFTVGIGFPCYRLSNGRTKAAQKEAIATKGLAADFFSLDPDSEAALGEQDKILRDMINQAGLLNILTKHEQDRPLILDNDGYIVNGNRRICAMRLLFEQDETKYSHFGRVQVLFLPPCNDRDIKELEGRLQVSPEGRAEYVWVAEAMLYRELREQGWNEDQISDLYEKKVVDVRELLAMLDDAEAYLAQRTLVGRYSLVLKKEYAFRQLQKSRKKMSGDEPRKQLLNAVAYLMLDDSDSSEGRLYEAIPDASKYLDQISHAIASEFKGDADQTPVSSGDLDLLGETPEILSPEVLRVIKVEKNHPRIRELIRDKLEQMRQEEREKRDATFCVRQVQQAYSKLQAALGAMDNGFERSGIEELLNNIDQTILQMRQRLSSVINKN